MGIHCNENPILKIKVDNAFKSDIYDIELFYNSKADMMQIFNCSFSVKELEAFYLYFESEDPNAKLFMDGLEFLPSDSIKYTDTNEIYLPPSTVFYPIYLYEQGYYPFRVGMYEIRIEENDKEYYALLQIEPKHLSEKDWILLRDDLENEVRGLSQDLIRKNIGFGSIEFATLPVEVLHKFLIINKYSNRLLGSLIDLKDKPNFKVEKEYVKKELYEAKQIDSVTIRNYLLRGTDEDKYLIPERIISYDLQENKWLKKIIEAYELNLKEFLSIIYNSKNAIKNEIKLLKNYKSASPQIEIKTNLLNQLNIYEKTANKILKISNIVKLQEWYGKITPLKNGRIPHVLFMDARYGILYQLYRDLQNQKFEIEIDKNYSYAWKNTYKLYEIWCYIKIYKLLTSENISFEQQSNIAITEAQHLLIPMILPETCIVLKKNNITLKYYYDKSIPTSSMETNRNNNPIFTTGRHNRPDARLDIYVDSLYIRSIIFEFKYRTIRNFWNKNNQSTSYDQIISYKDNTKSIFIENYKSKKSIEFRPVKEVWVFHPTFDKINDSQTLEKYDEGVKLIRMKPEESLEEVTKNLNNTINEIVSIVFDN